MAVVTTKSITITNRDAVPQVINDGRVERGALRSSHGYVTGVNGDSIGSKYVLASLPSTAMVRAVLLSSGALASGAADIGVYRNTKDGGAAVAAGLFGTGVSVATAQSRVDVTNESTTYTLDKQELPLWQAAGLASDPGSTLDIVATLTIALTAGGFLGVEVQYTDNGN